MRVRADSTKIGSALLHMQLKDPRLTGAWRSSAIGSTSLRNIRLTTLKSSPVLVPSKTVQSRAEVILRYLLELQDSLDLASANLQTTRDYLLPRLISSEIDVTDLDIVLAETAA
jgi:hypothetical protein